MSLVCALSLDFGGNLQDIFFIQKLRNICEYAIHTPS